MKKMQKVGLLGVVLVCGATTIGAMDPMLESAKMGLNNAKMALNETMLQLFYEDPDPNRMPDQADNTIGFAGRDRPCKRAKLLQAWGDALRV